MMWTLEQLDWYMDKVRTETPLQSVRSSDRAKVFRFKDKGADCREIQELLDGYYQAGILNVKVGWDAKKLPVQHRQPQLYTTPSSMLSSESVAKKLTNPRSEVDDMAWLSSVIGTSASPRMHDLTEEQNFVLLLEIFKSKLRVQTLTSHGISRLHHDFS